MYTSPERPFRWKLDALLLQFVVCSQSACPEEMLLHRDTGRTSCWMLDSICGCAGRIEAPIREKVAPPVRVTTKGLVSAHGWVLLDTGELPAEIGVARNGS